MAVPTSFTDLSTTPATNATYISGSDSPTVIDDHLRTVYSLIASVYANSGNGWASPYLTAGTLAASSGAAQVGFIQAGAGAVARTTQDKGREIVSALDFGATGDGTTDDTAALQAAITAAIIAGKSLYVPAGKYKITSTLYINRVSGESRADAFRMYGDGGGSVFLGYTLCSGTVIFTAADVPVLTFNEVATNYLNNFYIEYMRLDQTNAAATQPVVQLDIAGSYSRLAHLEIRQAGTGDGIKIDKFYVALIENCFVANRDLVNYGAGVARVGTGINMPSAAEGGLATVRKCSSRGFLNGYVIGDGVNSMFAPRLEQCESSTITNGIVVSAETGTAVIDQPYFEACYSQGVHDLGRATTVRDGFFFVTGGTGIVSTGNTHGNFYTGNTFYLQYANTIAIDILAAGDANGFQKSVRDNHIYFTTSGGTVAGVKGVRVTGANPAVSFTDNCFRPRRAWVGGSGSVKFDSSGITGSITGFIPVTDALNEYPLINNHSICFSPGAALTAASVSAGALTIAPSGSKFTVSEPTTATNVTSIVATDQRDRLVVFVFSNSANNLTFKKGVFMKLSADFTGEGSLTCDLRVVGGSVYLYELSRTVY